MSFHPSLPASELKGHWAHIAALALIITAAIIATGPWAVVAVPSVGALYVWAVYRKCPFRTETFFVCLYAAQLALLFSPMLWAPNFLEPTVAPASASRSVSATASALLAAAPVLIIAGFAVAGLASRRRMDSNTAKPIWGLASSGTLVAALLLTPVLCTALALVCVLCFSR